MWWIIHIISFIRRRVKRLTLYTAVFEFLTVNDKKTILVK